MKTILSILILFVLTAFYSCGKQQTVTDSADSTKNIKNFDFSLFYNADSTYTDSAEYIYYAHRNVPKGEMVVLADLDSLFGEPFLCDTVIQTSDEWYLYEQENPAARFLPKEVGDTLIMMRRIYGRQRDWMVWVDLEIQDSDSLRVLNFLAYDNDVIDI